MSRAEYDAALRRQFELGQVLEQAAQELHEATRHANLRAYFADTHPTAERQEVARVARERQQAALSKYTEAKAAHAEAQAAATELVFWSPGQKKVTPRQRGRRNVGP